MPIFPRPARPREAFADLRALWSENPRHRWPILGLSIALTSVIIWAFYVDSKSPPRPREIIYVESWMADRKDSDVLKKQKADLARYEEALKARQKDFQGFADAFGVEWREEAERNRAQREAVIAAVNKKIDERIAKAEAREAAAAKDSGR